MKEYCVKGGYCTENYMAKTASDAVDFFIDEYYPDWNVIGAFENKFECSGPCGTEIVSVREA